MNQLLQLAANEEIDLQTCASSSHSPNLHTPDDLTIVAEQCNRQDISAYVQSKLLNIRRLGYNLFHLHDSIITKSAGIFFWSVVVLQEIRKACENGKPLQIVSRIPECIPRSLNELFRNDSRYDRKSK